MKKRADKKDEHWDKQHEENQRKFDALIEGQSALIKKLA